MTFNFWIRSRYASGNVLELIFYGYCGSNIEDAIAIDDIVLDTRDISTAEDGYIHVQDDGNWMFIRGGIDATLIRPICLNDVDADTSQCSLSIETNSLGIGTPWASYVAWRVGDSKLDWFGAQAGQGAYMGITPFGTPFAWTTNNPAKPE
uniref:MAM domain-containing protein n=1 Tax=Daphnia galeata TaxID=27404 RepID=A0A8J2VZ42_9CRUS|nr:unnamed protein product [Daphnia galeata]